jgi:hypothetical protein
MLPPQSRFSPSIVIVQSTALLQILSYILFEFSAFQTHFIVFDRSTTEPLIYEKNMVFLYS